VIKIPFSQGIPFDAIEIRILVVDPKNILSPVPDRLSGRLRIFFLDISASQGIYYFLIKVMEFA